MNKMENDQGKPVVIQEEMTYGKGDKTNNHPIGNGTIYMVKTEVVETNKKNNDDIGVPNSTENQVEYGKYDIINLGKEGIPFI